MKAILRRRDGVVNEKIGARSQESEGRPSYAEASEGESQESESISTDFADYAETQSAGPSVASLPRDDTEGGEIGVRSWMLWVRFYKDWD